MVWALLGAPIKGRFIDFQFLDGAIEHIECEDMKQEGGLAFLRGSYAAQKGCRIKSEQVPTRIRWLSQQPVSDYGTPMGVPMVSSRFKAIVEDFELGLHQFMPLEVIDKRGKFLSSHWLFIPCHGISSADEAQTTMVKYKGGWSVPRDLIRRGEEHLLPDDYDPDEKIKFVFNEKKIGGCHFWREKGLMPSNQIFISDVAGDAIRKAELSGLQLLAKESV